MAAPISTTGIYTTSNPTWHYEAIPFSPDELPPPLPAASEMLPSERKEKREAEKREEQETRTVQAYDEAAKRKAQGGFINSLAASVKPAWTRLATSATPTTVKEPVPSKREERRFNDRFHFPQHERLLYASEQCKLASGDHQIIGKIYISDNFLCFRESNTQPKTTRSRLLLVIPVEDILSIALAAISSQGDPKLPPSFRILESFDPKADGIFIYARDMRIHRFYGFWTAQSFHDTYTVLDRVWRQHPFTSMQPAPLVRGVPIQDRAMLPPVRAAAPNVANLQPSTFIPGPVFFPTSQMGWSQQQRVGAQQVVMQPQPQPQLFQQQQGWGQQSRVEQRYSQFLLPWNLRDELRNAGRFSRLRHAQAPVVRTGGLLVDTGRGLEWTEFDRPASFFGAAAGRRFRSARYAPKQHEQFSGATGRVGQSGVWQHDYGGWQQEQQQWQQQEQTGMRRSQFVSQPQYGSSSYAGWRGQQQQPQQEQRLWRSEQTRPQRTSNLPPALLSGIRSFPRHRLQHIPEPVYQPTWARLGRVTDRPLQQSQSSRFRTSQRSWGRQSIYQQQMETQQQRSTVSRSAQFQRLGFQTVQKRLEAERRGRRIDPQLKDEVIYFERNRLRHVTPVVKQMQIRPGDIRMRVRQPSRQQVPVNVYEEEQHTLIPQDRRMPRSVLRGISSEAAALRLSKQEHPRLSLEQARQRWPENVLREIRSAPQRVSLRHVEVQQRPVVFPLGRAIERPTERVQTQTQTQTQTQPQMQTQGERAPVQQSSIEQSSFSQEQKEKTTQTLRTVEQEQSQGRQPSLGTKSAEAGTA